MQDFSQMLANLTETVPYVTILIQAVAGLLGLIFAAQGLHKFYLHNKRGEAQLGSGVMYLLSAVMLVNLALSINTAFDLLYGGSGASVEHLVAYKPSEALPTQAAMVMQVIVLLLQLFGFFYVVTGFVELRHLQDNRQASGTTFKGVMLRIFAGSALLNIVLTVNTLAGFVGFGKVM
jgi:intracellular multiplication protein IcmC